MPTRAEETRERMMMAKASLVMEADVKERRKNEALHELRTAGVNEWVEFETARIIAKADRAAEDRKGEVEIKLPRGAYGFYDMLRGKYYNTLDQFDIESVIPEVHKLIILSLRASGYKVTDPKDKEFPYEHDGMPMISHYKVITVSW